jgi:hypothetical protein
MSYLKKRELKWRVKLTIALHLKLSAGSDWMFRMLFHGFQEKFVLCELLPEEKAPQGK